MLPARPILRRDGRGIEVCARGCHRRDDDSGDQPDRRRLYWDLQIQPERRCCLPAICVDDHRRRPGGADPFLLLSTAAAIIVTRVSDNGDIAHDVRNQLLASPSVLYTATGIMFVLAVVPGMPHFPFLMFSALLGFTGWRMSKRPQAAEAEEKASKR